MATAATQSTGKQFACPCACGYMCTGKPSLTHCCQLCKKSPGQHGPHCLRLEVSKAEPPPRDGKGKGKQRVPDNAKGKGKQRVSDNAKGNGKQDYQDKSTIWFGVNLTSETSELRVEVSPGLEITSADPLKPPKFRPPPGLTLSASDDDSDASTTVPAS